MVQIGNNIKMKKIGLIVLILGFVGFVNAQTENFTEEDGELYLDSELYSGNYEVKKDEVVVSIFKFKNGMKNGKVTHFYTDGKTKEVGYYKANKKDGKWEKWDEKRNKTAEAYYEDGKKTGSWLVWDHKGTKRFEMFYTEGVKTGTWKIWDEEGVLTQERDF